MAAADAAGAAHRSIERLRRWLLDDAYPRWTRCALDRVHGGFHESIAWRGPNPDEPRRARVQLRQLYSFAQAPALGWRDDTTALVVDGLRYFMRHYRRPDGLYRTLVAPGGAPIDERALLYDQAFVLLALAACERTAGLGPETLAAARALRGTLHRRLGDAQGGFRSALPDEPLRLSNPHMHLLEAAIAWAAQSDDPEWPALADAVVALLLERLMDPARGVVREYFDAEWRPAEGLQGRVVEPGHMFEWASLLLAWSDHAATGTGAGGAARRLAAVAEAGGVHGGIVVDALLDDLGVHESSARLWPQTERLKAAVAMACAGGDPAWWLRAAEAVRAIERYFTPDLPGLWYDQLSADGQRRPHGVTSASTLYHLVGAVASITVVAPAARDA